MAKFGTVAPYFGAGFYPFLRKIARQQKPVKVGKKSIEVPWIAYCWMRYRKLRFSPEIEEDKNSDFCILITDISCKKPRSVVFGKFRSGQENNRNLFSVKIIMSTILYGSQ